MLELLTVIVISLTATAIAIPMFVTILRDLRTGGDARAINDDVGLAKMKAASDFTLARVRADLKANTFQLEVCQKAGANAGCIGGTWNLEGGVQALSSGVSLGDAGLGNPPPGTQAAIGQAAKCLDNAGADIADTACIVFNSRGIPVDATGVPDGSGAFYITDGDAVYGVTVSSMGLIQSWRSPATTAQWRQL